MTSRLDTPAAARIAGLFDEMMRTMGRASSGEMIQLIQRHGVTLPQIIAMELLDEEPQTVSSLAEHLRLTRGAVSRLIDQLVYKGLVTREEGVGGDRRRKALRLTAAGRRAAMQLTQARMGHIAPLLAILDPALSRDLEDMLRRIIALLPEKPGPTREPNEEPPFTPDSENAM